MCDVMPPRLVSPLSFKVYVVCLVHKLPELLVRLLKLLNVCLRNGYEVVIKFGVVRSDNETSGHRKRGYG